MTKRKDGSTYARNRRQPYRKQDILPAVEKCAYCGITRRQRKIDVREYPLHSGDTFQLVCDRCVVEAARGAKMDPDKDEWLSPGRPRVQLIGKGRHEYGSQLREPDGKFTVRR